MTINVLFITTEEEVEVTVDQPEETHDKPCRCVDCYGDFSNATSWDGEQ